MRALSGVLTLSYCVGVSGAGKYGGYPLPDVAAGINNKNQVTSIKILKISIISYSLGRNQGHIFREKTFLGKTHLGTFANTSQAIVRRHPSYLVKHLKTLNQPQFISTRSTQLKMTRNLK